MFRFFLIVDVVYIVHGNYLAHLFLSIFIFLIRSISLSPFIYISSFFYLPNFFAHCWSDPNLFFFPNLTCRTQAKDTVRMSNASTIHVVDEEVTGWATITKAIFFWICKSSSEICIYFSDYNLNNDNHGYVDDVDDPRHDWSKSKSWLKPNPRQY